MRAAAAVGLPYVGLTGDMVRANYSNLRGALLDFRRRASAFQHGVLVFLMCRPVVTARGWSCWQPFAVFFLTRPLNLRRVHSRSLTHSCRPVTVLSSSLQRQCLAHLRCPPSQHPGIEPSTSSVIARHANHLSYESPRVFLTPPLGRGVGVLYAILYLLYLYNILQCRSAGTLNSWCSGYEGEPSTCALSENKGHGFESRTVHCIWEADRPHYIGRCLNILRQPCYGLHPPTV